MDTHDIGSLLELRRLYGRLPENSLARRMIFPKLHRHHRAFIALSPFVVIASADRDGAPDVSPRGDLPGFAAILDDRTIVLPDRPGNKKLMTLTNVLENSAVSLIFYVPGRTESLRVNGRAQITTDPALLLPLAAYGKLPQTALVVAVELAWLHCGRALIRSRLWEPNSWPAADALPSLGAMIAEEIGDIDAAEAESKLERANTVLLWGEPAPAPGDRTLKSESRR
jgi:PPOX class probable FMN-dependent enzyme